MGHELSLFVGTFATLLAIINPPLQTSPKLWRSGW
jgi:hypothetical protein